MTDFFLGSKITADGDCSYEIRRRLLFGRKMRTNVDSVLKSRDGTLPTKVHIVKVMVFPAITSGCDSWIIKKAECQRIDAFKVCCWRSPWNSLGQQGDQASQSLGKSTLNIHWKDWSWSWSSSILVTWCKQTTHWKSPWFWERSRAEEKKASEDEMIGWHHQCNEHEPGPIPGDEERQGGMLQYMGSWRVGTMWWLNNNNNIPYFSQTII